MGVPETQLNEIFSSFQGEGLYVGERQIFLRFSGCNLSCQYCDSPEALTLTPTFRCEQDALTRKSTLGKNPIRVDELIPIISQLNKPIGLHHSISLTGGEPLLQVDFLKDFLPELRKKCELKTYLETNGTLPDHLAEVIDYLDIIAMDMKLPGATGLSDYWKEHRKFLETAYLKEVFVKLIFTKETKIKEVDEAVSIIAALDDKIPLVLQPATPHGQIKHFPDAEHVFSFFNTAKRKLKHVRVIPQSHKVINVK